MKDPTMYIGIDAHKSFSYVTVEDKKGRLIKEGKVTNFSSEFEDFFRKFSNAKAAIEASTVVWPIVDKLEELGIESTVAHPAKIKGIADAQIKTDQRDSGKLAQLLRLGFLPESYIPSKEIREWRNAVRNKARLVDMRSGIVYQINSMILMKGINYKKSVLRKDGRERAVLLKDPTIDRRIKLIDEINKLVREEEIEINKMAKGIKEARILQTMPGIGYFTALLLTAEIGDINRFPRSDKLCAYAALVPSLHQSGSTRRLGHTIKQGNNWIKRYMIQCANVAVRINPKMRAKYLELKKIKGHCKAIVAIARRMLSVIYWMLKRTLSYEEVCADKSLG